MKTRLDKYNYYVFWCVSTVIICYIVECAECLLSVLDNVISKKWKPQSGTIAAAVIVPNVDYLRDL